MKLRLFAIPAPRRFKNIIAALLLVSLCLPVAAQKAGTPAPRREQLLNGLRLLLVQRAGDPQVLLKLRINSGAAFDLSGREGLMTLLGDALFPDMDETRRYVEEELNGRLEVNTSYDHMEILLSGKTSDFERLVELLRNAVLQMRLDAGDVNRLREARLKAARDAAQQPALLADHAAAARLYRSYPYGRALAGTPESLARIDRPDLMQARDRFINPNNSLLVLVGGVEGPRAMRAFRQLLGSWRKSDSISPATFTQPDAPDARTLIVNLPGASEAEVRLATRAPSRADRDHATTVVATLILEKRLTSALKEFQPKSVFTSYQGHSLSGIAWLSINVPSRFAAQALETTRATIAAFAASPVSAAELETERSNALNMLTKRRARPDAFADELLDAITYNTTFADDERVLNALTSADVQRVAARLFGGEAKLASVVAGDAAQLRSELTRNGGGVEVAEANPAPPPAATDTKTPKRP